MKTATRVVTVALSLFAAGCQLGEEELNVASTEQAVEMSNGTWLNGTWVNGTWLNGTWLNGTWVNGTWVNGTWLNGTWLNGVSISGTELVSSDGYSGTDFIGAYIYGTDLSGDKVTMKIFDIETAPDPTPLWLYRYGMWRNYSINENADVKLYTIKYWRYSSYKGWYWSSICGTDANGNAIPAIPVAGLWDYNYGEPGDGGKITSSNKKVTFSCHEKGAIAKCVVGGYKPWQSWTQNKTHQACVRMVRADYCGDGVSWTANGTEINVYDPYGINTDTDPYAAFEARWSRYGATCMNEARKPDVWDIYYGKDHAACNVGSYVTQQSHCNGETREYNVVTEK